MTFKELAEYCEDLDFNYPEGVVLGYNISYKTPMGIFQLKWPFDYPTFEVERCVFKVKEKEETDIVPTLAVTQAHLNDGVLLAEVLKYLGMAKSTSDGRRLIKGKGIRVNGVCVEDENHKLTEDDMYGNVIDIGKGKSGKAQVKIR